MLNDGVCIRLKLFGEDIKRLLANNNWKETCSEKADYIFINSCSFLLSKEKEFLRIINKQNERKKDNQKICVFGCLPSTNQEKILEINKNVILFHRNLDEIKDFFKLDKAKIGISHVTSRKLSASGRIIYLINKILKDSTIEYRLNKEKVFHLKISEGCLGNCSYCSEKFTTRLKSRKIKAILADFEKGLEEGYKIFALNADDTSVFGLDNKEDIYSLLSRINSHKEDFKLAITEFNPFGLLDKRIFSALNSKKIIFITIPVQSGSQRILDKMNRPYDIKEVIAIIKKLKEINTNLKINTHIIIGFPGETKEDFKKTLDLIDKNIFDRIKIFQYNDRPGTKASFMEQKISEKEKQERFMRLKRKIIINFAKKGDISNILVNCLKIL